MPFNSGTPAQSGVVGMLTSGAIRAHLFGVLN